MKALLAWEIGGGQGHIRLLKAMGEQLLKKGIQPIFALRSPPQNLVLPGPVVQAPITTPIPGTKPSESYHFGDILHKFGFQAPELHYNVRAWQQLFHLTRVSFLVADFAPTAVVAARGKLPTIVVGHGFAIPPPQSFPQLRPGTLPNSSIESTEITQTAASAVTGCNILLPQLLQGDRTLIFSVPALDPYFSARTPSTIYVGHYEAPFKQHLFNLQGPAWSYLQPSEQTTEIYKTFHPQRDSGPFSSVLQGKSLAIHQGNFGTALACLLIGMPQLVFPKDLEKWITTNQLETLGVAINGSSIVPTQWLAHVRFQLPQLAAAAKTTAINHRCWNACYLESAIAECLESLNLS